MGNQTFISKVKNVVYKLVLPVYLWSIGFQSLDDYVEAIVLSEGLNGHGKHGM